MNLYTKMKKAAGAVLAVAMGMTCIPTPLAVYAQEPEEYTVILEENFESELSAGVKLSGEVSVAKISAGWAALSTADCAKVLNATAPDSMTVQYFFGGVRTANMYAGDRTADLKAARDGQAVWEVAVNLIEF